MSFLTLILTLLSAGTALVLSAPVNTTQDNVITCFPALNFDMPTTLPKDNTEWWCNPSTEFAFLGFSYEVTACMSLTTPRLISVTDICSPGQSPSQLNKEFSDIRNHFRGRYVRLYGFCDNEGF